MGDSVDVDERGTQESAKSIQAIDKTSVHRICSGQVILNLATAVKELVENSIDAGATQIEVNLKEYGSELVQVIDNGSGVEEVNFEGLTLKHHTSKLRDFSDLVDVDTFGFRGEALSSLCALSQLSVITCHKSTSVGTKLEYDHHGKLTNRSPCPRQHGTTINLANLFTTLPVRHKEFQRNLKKEYAKMVHILSAYCLISVGVRITCTNQVGKKAKSVVVKTAGSASFQDNITDVFGIKQFSSLLSMELHRPDGTACEEYGIKSEESKSQVFDIKGYISTCQHGSGRSSSDRQFYFINKRPCDPLKITRLVNEVYHMYNRHQYPFVLLDISFHKDFVDVNVTPDKRQIFMQKEKLLLATLKTSLIRLFEPQASTYQLQQPKMTSTVLSFSTTKSPVIGKSGSPMKSQIHSDSSPKVGFSSSLVSLKRSFESAFARNKDSPSKVEERGNKQRRLDSFILKRNSDPEICRDSARNCSDAGEVLELSVQTLPNDSDQPQTDKAPSVITLSGQSSSDSGMVMESSQETGSTSASNDADDNGTVNYNHQSLHEDIVQDEGELVSEDGQEHQRGITVENSNHQARSGQVIELTISPVNSTSHCNTPSKESPSHQSLTGDLPSSVTITPTEIDAPEELQRRSLNLGFSLGQLRSSLQKKQETQEAKAVKARSFISRIMPGENAAAEDELRREISKDMFAKMEILGQFNLGFIITRLKEDLFIVDQHATDEKYNFEELQRHTVIKSQKLIQPQCLGLTSVNEGILIDNVDVFRKNGFEFLINEQADPTQRVKLTSVPVSKNWLFGKEDIEELIFMLTDSPGVLCRPSRVRSMFASRACRSSVMIGTALNKSEMRKLVCHMGEIDQPWNCPHGRPTMRHLINLNTVPR